MKTGRSLICGPFYCVMLAVIKQLSWRVLVFQLQLAQSA